MFRRVYIHIASILIMSTLAVLTIVGGLLYLELQQQLAADSKTSLMSEMDELVGTIRSAHSLNSQTLQSLNWADERGQNVYYAVVGPRLTLTANGNPVPVAVLVQHMARHGYETFSDSNGKPYRVYERDLHYHGKTLQLFIYKLIVQEQETLNHLRNLLFISGAAGIAISTALNLMVARRALTPARKTWEAHRDTMIELSHELQTPLATLSALVGAHVTDATLKSQLAREIQVASNMVKDVLYLSRLRAIPLSPNMEPVAVSDLTEESAERFAPLAEKQTIRLIGVPIYGLYVMTTRERWDRVVSTLFKNVVDHAAPHSTAEWSLKSYGSRVILELQNVPKASTDLASSHGFGLSIVDRLVRDMQGTLAIQDGEDLFQVTVDVPMAK